MGKLSEEQVSQMRNLWEGGVSPKDLADQFGVSKATVYARMGNKKKQKSKRAVYTTVPLEAPPLERTTTKSPQIAMFLGEPSAIAQTLGELWK